MSIAVEQRLVQLVATLHDTTPMKGTLDRDQIWLVDKDPTTEASSLTPRNTLKPGRRESLDRGYLGGRYGGVPVIPEYGLGSREPRERARHQVQTPGGPWLRLGICRVPTTGSHPLQRFSHVSSG